MKPRVGRALVIVCLLLCLSLSGVAFGFSMKSLVDSKRVYDTTQWKHAVLVSPLMTPTKIKEEVAKEEEEEEKFTDAARDANDGRAQKRGGGGAGVSNTQSQRNDEKGFVVTVIPPLPHAMAHPVYDLSRDVVQGVLRSLQLAQDTACVDGKGNLLWATADAETVHFHIEYTSASSTHACLLRLTSDGVIKQCSTPFSVHHHPLLPRNEKRRGGDEVVVVSSKEEEMAPSSSLLSSSRLDATFVLRPGDSVYYAVVSLSSDDGCEEDTLRPSFIRTTLVEVFQRGN